MPKIKINGKDIEFQKGMTVLQACELADVEIPRFCYHEKLSIQLSFVVVFEQYSG